MSHRAEEGNQKQFTKLLRRIEKQRCRSVHEDVPPMCAKALALDAGSRVDRLRVQLYQFTAEGSAINHSGEPVGVSYALEKVGRAEAVTEALLGLTEAEKRDSVSRGAQYHMLLDLDVMVMGVLAGAATAHCSVASFEPHGVEIVIGSPVRVVAIGGDYSRAIAKISKVTPQSSV